MEQITNKIIEHNGLPVMSKAEYITWLETTVASLLMASDHNDKVINSLIRQVTLLEDQHREDTKMWINNPLNATKEYKA